MITLAEDMACTTTDSSSNELLERWLELAPVLFFGVELPDAIVYKHSRAFVDFNFIFYNVGM